MSFAENSFTAINEYGFSLFKSKFDPLAAIEAKTAMTKKTQVVLSLSLDRALVARMIQLKPKKFPLSLKKQRKKCLRIEPYC